jgi:hypothetical protein
MSELTDLFTGIANSIRTKNKSTAVIPAKNFPSEIANISTDECRMEAGTKSIANSLSVATFNLTFSSKIIAIFFTIGTTTNSSTSWRSPTYYVNPETNFFKKRNVAFDVNGLSSTPINYIKDSKYYSQATKVDDYSVTIKGTVGTASGWDLNYVAILEP